ncbi:MAG: hypothetical protein J6S71_03995 [Clostridia bacterium]|nr:hypothetical protein [Clostridia bacterium]
MKLQSKNFVCLFILISMLLSLIPLTAAALSAGSTLSTEEALNLIIKANDFCVTAVDGHAYNGLLNYNSKIEVQIDNDINHTYYAVYEEKLPGGSYQAMYELARDIFCENIFTIFEIQSGVYKNSTDMFYSIPRYYISDDGKVYACHHIDDFSYAGFYSNLEGIKFVKGNSSNATYYIKTWVGHELDVYLAWAKVNFVNTKNGWRIDQCTYTDILADDMALNVWEKDLIPYVEAPSTADSAFSLVFILPTVSVAALTSAFGLMHRRRKFI